MSSVSRHILNKMYKVWGHFEWKRRKKTDIKSFFLFLDLCTKQLSCRVVCIPSFYDNPKHSLGFLVKDIFYENTFISPMYLYFKPLIPLPLVPLLNSLFSNTPCPYLNPQGHHKVTAQYALVFLFLIIHSAPSLINPAIRISPNVVQMKQNACCFYHVAHKMDENKPVSVLTINIVVIVNSRNLIDFRLYSVSVFVNFIFSVLGTSLDILVITLNHYRT